MGVEFFLGLGFWGLGFWSLGLLVLGFWGWGLVSGLRFERRLRRSTRTLKVTTHG